MGRQWGMIFVHRKWREIHQLFRHRMRQYSCSRLRSLCENHCPMSSQSSQYFHIAAEVRHMWCDTNNDSKNCQDCREGITGILSRSLETPLSFFRTYKVSSLGNTLDIPGIREQLWGIFQMQDICPPFSPPPATSPQHTNMPFHQKLDRPLVFDLQTFDVRVQCKYCHFYVFFLKLNIQGT